MDAVGMGEMSSELRTPCLQRDAPLNQPHHGNRAATVLANGRPQRRPVVPRRRRHWVSGRIVPHVELQHLQGSTATRASCIAAYPFADGRTWVRFVGTLLLGQFTRRRQGREVDGLEDVFVQLFGGFRVERHAANKIDDVTISHFCPQTTALNRFQA